MLLEESNCGFNLFTKKTVLKKINVFKKKDLEDKAKFKDGYNQMVSDNGTDLSGGQKRRINLAR